MELKSSVVVGASIIVASLIVAFTQPPKVSSATPTASVSAEGPIGRFQFGSVTGHAYVLDTMTGQVWETFASSSGGPVMQDFYSNKVKAKP